MGSLLTPGDYLILSGVLVSEVVTFRRRNVTMNLLVLAIAVAGMISAILALAFICFVVGVKRGDRAELDLAPADACSRFARRVAGLHASSARSLAAEETRSKGQLQNTN